MRQKIEVLAGPRARVIRQEMRPDGQVIKSVIPIKTRLTPAERRQVELQVEWERWLRLKLRG